MRLWHYKLLPYLPKSQLISQWRELNSIYKKQDKHILINYIYEYPKHDLFLYSLYVILELNCRNIKIKNNVNFINYFKDYINYLDKEAKLLFIDIYKIFKFIDYICMLIKFYEAILNIVNPFINHQDNRYLIQNFYNLQEKYDRGQKDFTKERYVELANYVVNNYIIKEYPCMKELTLEFDENFKG